MEISEVTPAPERKWPRWTWFAYPALAIAIGGGLGYVVAIARQETDPSPLAAEPPMVAAPSPSTPRSEVAPASPEIEVAPEPVKAAGDGLAPGVTLKPKGKPKPTKSTRCNVYDHMNGC